MLDFARKLPQCCFHSGVLATNSLKGWSKTNLRVRSLIIRRPVMDHYATENLLWEDKEIKFDILNLHNNLRNGESVLQTIKYIEDSKGNPGQTGRLLATNLRIIWFSEVHKKYNLSIGYARIANTSTRLTYNKARGSTQALYVLANGSQTRFEFLFIDVSGESAKRHETLFNNIFEIYRLYQRTYLYRNLKLRGAILQSGLLIVMPQEQIFSNVNGVWNLSSDQGNLGKFIITNIRLVWFADANETFNISLPYLQISSIRLRDSKYGIALVVQTAQTGGSYVLGFRIDPVERLHEVHQQLVSLHSVYTQNPNFGIHFETLQAQLQERQEAADLDASSAAIKVDEFQEIDEQQERELNSKLNTYLAEGFMPRTSNGEETKSREPVYCKDLGFALERIRSGYTLKDLWDVLPSTLQDVDEQDE